MAAGVVQKWSDYRKTVVIVYADYRDVENYISWEMTPTSIGGEKQASISGGSHLPADIASGRIAEVRSKNAKAFLNK